MARTRESIIWFCISSSPPPISGANPLGSGHMNAANPVAVTIDYPGLESRGRVEDMAGDVDFPLVSLLDGRRPEALDATAYAAALIAPLDADPRPVGLVVAYCTAAPIGHEAARLLGERRGARPALVTLDGSGCPSTMVDAVYDSLLSRYTGASAGPDAEVSAAELRAAPQAVLGRMRDELTSAAARVLLADLGDPSLANEFAGQLVEEAVDWLRHLIAAHNADFTPWPGPVFMIGSTEPGFVGDWPGAAVTTTETVPCPRSELLRHPSTAALLATAMRSFTGTPPARC
ncbi:hypothetical protein ACLQ26_27705 [Micromonospora sp. DT43]|uniref:hypothetical protein n=1 Tax=Micromonospora sp. DT43 TaxID=3393440 RepID=UPI003CE6FC2B